MLTGTEDLRGSIKCEHVNKLTDFFYPLHS